MEWNILSEIDIERNRKEKELIEQANSCNHFPSEFTG
mgnify:CR=1 FL=1